MMIFLCAKLGELTVGLVLGLGVSCRYTPQCRVGDYQPIGSCINYWLAVMMQRCLLAADSEESREVWCQSAKTHCLRWLSALPVLTAGNVKWRPLLPTYWCLWQRDTCLSRMLFTAFGSFELLRFIIAHCGCFSNAL